MATATAQPAKSTGTKIKTYVILDELKPTAPIHYGITPKTKMRIEKLPSASAFLQSTFTDADGQNKTARLKLNANSIWQDEQVKAGIPANEKFTKAERRAVKFVNGMLITNKAIVQTYLESIPQFSDFVGDAPNGERKLYKRYDRDVDIKTENEAFKARLKAANVIMDLGLVDAQQMLVAIYGTSYQVPDNLEEAQNVLIDYIDDTEGGHEKVTKLSKGLNADQEIRVVINTLERAKVLSFTEIPDQIARKRDGKWMEIKESTGSLAMEERVSLFVTFLASAEGKTLLSDLKKDAAEFNKDKN